MFARVAVPGLVVILAPNHTGVCEADGGVSLWEAGFFRTPLGDIPVDTAFAAVTVFCWLVRSRWAVESVRKRMISSAIL